MKLSHALRVKSGDVIALVGGGGKTTAMFQLARELTQISTPKMRVLITTSTRIFAAQIKQAPTCVTFDPDRETIEKILPQLEAAIARHGQVLLIGRTDSESGKAFGLEPQVIDQLAALGSFDIILNEADGSRMRPFKAPAAHEPVIPSSTTVVVPVAGIDVVNRLLNEDTVHRPALVSQLGELPLNQPITAETVARVLSHPQGGLKRVPSQARFVPLLNKVEDRNRLAAARQIALKLITNDRVDSVVLAAVQQSESPVAEVYGRTVAIVLAAGGSTRFGSPKQLARWGEQTFIERAVDVALSAQHVQAVAVVLGAEIEGCRAVLGDRPVQIVINDRWREGQSTSMQAGLKAVSAYASSVIFLLVDLPKLTPSVVDSLIERHRQTLAPIVWPEFEGKRGNPVLFDRSLFSQLMQIEGDIGGRPLLKAYQAQAERVVVTDPTILHDFDRPEDMQID